MFENINTVIAIIINNSLPLVLELDKFRCELIPLVKARDVLEGANGFFITSIAFSCILIKIL